jgi:hypothetical protein
LCGGEDVHSVSEAVPISLLPNCCRLQDAVREAEGEGELVLQQLGAGELGVEAFVERYTKAQAKYHQRDLKLQAAQQTLQH